MLPSKSVIHDVEISKQVTHVFFSLLKYVFNETVNRSADSAPKETNKTGQDKWTQGCDQPHPVSRACELHEQHVASAVELLELTSNVNELRRRPEISLDFRFQTCDLKSFPALGDMKYNVLQCSSLRSRVSAVLQGSERSLKLCVMSFTTAAFFFFFF